jgi:5'(3')-deoxyribonucleotidase
MHRVAIDIDEVLTPLLKTMVKWRPPARALPAVYPYVYRKIYNITEEESKKMVREFYETPEFANLPVMPYAYKTLNKLVQNDYKLYVVTGRQHVVRAQTEEWVSENFPGIFTDVILTNSYTPGEVKKVDVCQMLNIGLLIDDNLVACSECLDRNIVAINFVGDPMYPWCLPSSISMNSWKSAYDILTENR